jgi:hypothetical protein
MFACPRANYFDDEVEVEEDLPAFLPEQNENEIFLYDSSGKCVQKCQGVPTAKGMEYSYMQDGRIHTISVNRVRV